METFSTDYSLKKLAQDLRNVVAREQCIDKEGFVCFFVCLKRKEA